MASTVSKGQDLTSTITDGTGWLQMIRHWLLSINLHNKPVNPIGGGCDWPGFNQMVKLVAVIPAHLPHYRASFFSQCQCPMMRTRFRLCYQREL